MATYLKRTSKLFDVSLSQASTEVNLRDVICPVCRGILTEPVTLPCTHNLCLRCLNGTFEHNSLSCPLCRVRVGSWLRSATKSETLINSELWDLIRSRFPKEIERKHNERDDETAADAIYPPKIISATGEIRREYEIQLQIAEEEMRIQRKAEIMANEALIRKLHEEEQQKLAQYAQDQLLAKTLAKQQLLTKEKNGTLHNCSKMRMPSNEVQILPLGREAAMEPNELISYSKKGRTKTSNMDANSFDITKSSQLPENLGFDLKFATSRKGCGQGLISVHNVATLEHQSVMLIQNANCHYSEPSCSNSKIYGTRSEEEFHVPTDVSSSSKSLGVEFCITTIKNDDERIGSAESAGSHDSINQEIHHFKPIRSMPRTPLRFSQDGRQIDPKLIRVVPIFEPLSNVPLKPPAPSKRIIGCSWSAFREFLITGKIQQNPRSDSTAGLQAPSVQPNQTSKLLKHETIRRIDLAQDTPFDNNKNYAKRMNRILNGTKVSKKLILDDETEDTTVNTWKTHMKNGSAEKIKKYNNPNEKKNLSADENSSPSFIRASLEILPSDDNGVVIENIAERIKKRKVAPSQPIGSVVRKIQSPQKMRSKTVGLTKGETNPPLKSKRTIVSKSKQLKVQFINETEIGEPSTVGDVRMKKVKASRKPFKSESKERIDASNESMEEEGNENFDDVAIREQGKMERLLRQEKEDYELARRLQAQFNEIESISCRTRGSKRAFDSSEIDRGVNKSKISDRLVMKDGNTATTSSRMTKSRQREKRD